MTLFLDIGNTAVKWRVASDGSEGSFLHNKDWEKIAFYLQSLIGEKVGQVCVASVVGESADEIIGRGLRKNLGVDVQFYYSEERCLGVGSVYEVPARLGVDRWLTMIEAYNLAGASIIIDCGSAITVDGVSGQGLHVGGYIVPGHKMQKAVLLGSTGAVLIDGDEFETMSPGRSTKVAVEHGIRLMCVSFIERAVAELRTAIHDDCSIYLTGGDGLAFARYFNFRSVYLGSMVLDGLQRVIETRLKAES